MKIQCDVCEKSPASVICCADEAALCAKCDVEIHKANKLASKHQRLVLDGLSNKFPRCDICQEKTAFIFCVEDRALFCRDCDEHIHVEGSLSGNHQRFLATGIRVAFSAPCVKNSNQVTSEPPQSENPATIKKRPTALGNAGESTVHPLIHQQHQAYTPPESWTVNELLQLSDFETTNKIYLSLPRNCIRAIKSRISKFSEYHNNWKLQKETIEFGELEWITNIGLFDDHMTQEAVQVPQLHTPSFDLTSSRPDKFPLSLKKPRMEINPDDFFIVPDLGDISD